MGRCPLKQEAMTMSGVWACKCTWAWPHVGLLFEPGS